MAINTKRLLSKAVFLVIKVMRQAGDTALVGWSNNCYFGNTQFLSSSDCETMLGWSILPVASGQLLVGRQEAFVMA